MVASTTRKGRESIGVYALLRDGLAVAGKTQQSDVRTTHVFIVRRLAVKLEREGADGDLETILQNETLELAPHEIRHTVPSRWCS
jgi:hypothetical protein